MADEPFNTLSGLIARLQQIAEHIDPQSTIRINGEYLLNLSISVRNPLAIYGEASGVEEFGKDFNRKSVVVIDANDHRSENLPDVRYPYFRRPRA